jgi:hypothetical protein
MMAADTPAVKNSEELDTEIAMAILDVCNEYNLPQEFVIKMIWEMVDAKKAGMSSFEAIMELLGKIPKYKAQGSGEALCNV